MARIVIDGKETSVSRTADVIRPDDKMVTVGGKDGSYRIVPAYQAREMPPEMIDTLERNQTNQEQGMYGDFNTRKKYIDMELPHICDFLDKFQFSTAGIESVISIDSDYVKMGIKNFPLPDEYRPDYEDIAIIIAEYPNSPPTGIYVKDISLNISKIKEKMNYSHVYDRAKYENYSFVYDVPGWTWICFHYENHSWKFNFSDFRSGDNLTKFIKGVYANLSGNFGG
jgi:hypothetical protein